MDYKETLNLPRTKFAMKANLPQREPICLARWRNAKIYQQLRRSRAGKPIFVLHDGPPYANGLIHIGHAVNKVLKDIIIKYKNLDGFDAPYVPGWDCHGLPIELNVEKQHGKAGATVTPEVFRSLCRSYAEIQIELQKKDFMRLGIIGDWDNPYLTMHAPVEANIVRSLAAIYKNGYIKKGDKPVHWCFECMSSLAEAELEYVNKRSTAVDVGFALVPNEAAAFLYQHLPKESVIYAVIWTTTPWTLPANQAVCINPTIRYSLVKQETYYLLLATDTLTNAEGRYECELTVITEITGDKLCGLYLQHLFADKTVPILAADHVATDIGTGLVHTAPDHGVDDFLVCQAHQINTLHLLDSRGVYEISTPVVGGMHIWRAEDTIINHIKQLGNFVHVKAFEHSYPHCWRHKTPVIFRATSQFFISMEAVARKAQIAVNKVAFFPSSGKERLQLMLDNRPDWCISRQRFWGVPIPFFLHKKTAELHPNTYALMMRIADMVEAQGLEAWFKLDASQLLGEQAAEYEALTHTLDVWYDSGTSHHSVLRPRTELTFPADVYLEGSDQHRGWFQSSLLSSIAIDGTVPYKHIVTHGFVVDENGKKMSKSLGNVISPQTIVDDKGADVLRLWVAMSDYHDEISISQTILQSSVDLYRRIRNTARFMLANLADCTPDTLLAPDQWTAIDSWIVAHAKALQIDIQQQSERYNFVAIVQAIYHFSCDQLGSVYLDIIKDRQYTAQRDSQARRSAQSALYHLIHAFARWLAPFITFTAEEIYSHIPGTSDSDSILLETWYQLPIIKPTITESDWELLLKVREAVHKVAENKRNNKQIGSLLSCNLVLYVDAAVASRLAPYLNELHFFFITSSVTIATFDGSAGEASIIPNMRIAITNSDAPKCTRCWHHNTTIGTHAAHPQLCARCVMNIETIGETRRFF